jgi:CheY-like chemotaxis protein
MPADEANARETGCDGYMTKPIDTQGRLRGLIRGFLDQ